MCKWQYKQNQTGSNACKFFIHFFCNSFAENWGHWLIGLSAANEFWWQTSTQRRKLVSASTEVARSVMLRGVVGWERVPTPFCTSNVTWGCGIKTITLKHGCNFTDVLKTRRFALLDKSLHEKGRSSVESLVRECSLYSNYLVQSSFLFSVGTAFPHLFF